MPVLKTRGSFRRYHIEGAPIDLTAPETFAALREQSFHAIDDTPTEAESSGWVSPWDPTGRDLREEDVRFGARLTLAIRLDKKRVPGSLVKIHAMAEERAEREALGVEHLPKKKRQEIRQRVEADLLARALPSVALHQVFIDTLRRIVLLQGTSDRLATTLAQLFQRTFGRGLRELSAGPLAERLESDPERQQYIERLGPLLLMPPPRRLVEIVPFTGGAADGDAFRDDRRSRAALDRDSIDAEELDDEVSAFEDGAFDDEVDAAEDDANAGGFGAGIDAEDAADEEVAR
ncbi:MAG: recombination-associated protein RdgC [Planctomycetes bacterium]|nr:recombination-associated protein RdgC [Planctomycetota bacterium]